MLVAKLVQDTQSACLDCPDNGESLPGSGRCLQPVAGCGLLVVGAAGLTTAGLTDLAVLAPRTSVTASLNPQPRSCLKADDCRSGRLRHKSAIPTFHKLHHI